MVNLDAKEARLHRMAHELQECGVEVPGLVSHTKDLEDPTAILPEMHHRIGQSQKNVIDLRVWQLEHPHDPAVQVYASIISCTYSIHLICPS